MSEQELRKLISEGLREGVSEEDQMVDTEEFENSIGIDDEVPMSAVDMPIQDKGVFSAMDAGENIDDFTDIKSKYARQGDDYEGGFQDDVSVSPGYFNEEEEYEIDDLPLSAIDMPAKEKNVFDALSGEEEVEDDLTMVKSKFARQGNDYEGGFQDDVSVSPGYFNENKVVKVTVDELQKIIKEGVAQLHKKTLIENRIEQINNELNALSNPEAWDNARMDAQEQLKKKHVAWQEITTRGKLM